jgi:glycerol-3-phosphate dehydrogenase (NAD(P)+)
MSDSMKTVAVLGGGSFGTALAQLAARQGQVVRLWMRDAEQAASINQTRHNPRYLSDFELHENISATSNEQEALEGADWVMVAVPSQAVRGCLMEAKQYLAEVPLVLAAKGIETESLMTMDEVVHDVLGSDWENRTLAMSGPSFAKEIIQGMPTAVVMACKDEALAARIADILFSDTFRAYTSTDIVGVEVGGALKNVMAIAAGGVIGMGWGHNVRASLVTRGLSEITRIAVAKGANPLTLSGLAGVGDLMLTCTGGLSRNRAVGQALGEGKTLEQAQESIKQVAEGVITAKSAYLLIEKLGVDCPIIETVYRVLYEGVPIDKAVQGLVERPTGQELQYD